MIGSVSMIGSDFLICFGAVIRFDGFVRPPYHQSHCKHGVQKQSGQHLTDRTPGRGIIIHKLLDLRNGEQAAPVRNANSHAATITANGRGS